MAKTQGKEVGNCKISLIQRLSKAAGEILPLFWLSFDKFKLKVAKGIDICVQEWYNEMYVCFIRTFAAVGHYTERFDI